MDSGSSEGTGDVPYQTGCSDPQPRQVFTSIAVGLTSQVGVKLKGKIWANEYVDFGSLWFSSPRNEGKYSSSMSPSPGLSNQPQLTLPSAFKISNNGCPPLISLFRFIQSDSKMKPPNL